MTKSGACEKCPFLSEQDEQKVCEAISKLKTKWIDECGFDELFQFKITPHSCPLKESEQNYRK